MNGSGVLIREQSAGPLSYMDEWVMKFVGPMLPEFERVEVKKTRWKSPETGSWYTDWSLNECAPSARGLDGPTRNVLRMDVRLIAPSESSTYWDAGVQVRMRATIEGANGMMYTSPGGMVTADVFYKQAFEKVVKWLDMDSSGWVY